MRRVMRALLGGVTSDDPEGVDDDVDAGQLETYETDTDGSSYSVDVPKAALAAAPNGAAGAVNSAPVEKGEAPAMVTAPAEAEAGLGGAVAGAKAAAGAAAGGLGAPALDNSVAVADSAPVENGEVLVQQSSELRASLAEAKVPDSAFGLDAKLPAVGGSGTGNPGTAAPPPTPARAHYGLRSRKNDSVFQPAPLRAAGVIAVASGARAVPSVHDARDAGAPALAPVLVPSHASLRPRRDASRPEDMLGAGGDAAQRSGADDINSHVVKFKAIDSRLKEVEDASSESLRAICHRMGLANSGSKDVLRARAREAACGLTGERAGTRRLGRDEGKIVKDDGVEGLVNGEEEGTADHARTTRPRVVREYAGEVVQQAPSESARTEFLTHGRRADGATNVTAKAQDADVDGTDHRHQVEQSNTRTTTTRTQPPPDPVNAPVEGTPARASDGKCAVDNGVADFEKNEGEKYATPEGQRKALETKSLHGITHLSTPGPERDPTNTSTADASGGEKMHRGETGVRRSTLKIPIMPRFIEDPAAFPALSPNAADQGGLGTATADPVSGLATQAAVGGLCESVDAQFHAASRNDLDGVQDQTSAAFYGVKEAPPAMNVEMPASSPAELHARDASCASPVRSAAALPTALPSSGIRVSPSKEGTFSLAAGDRGAKLGAEKFESPQNRMAPNVSGNLMRSSPLEADRNVQSEVARPDFENSAGGAARAPSETFLPPPPPTPADPSAAKKKNTNVMTSLQALGKRGFVTMNSEAALGDSRTDNAFVAERPCRQTSPSKTGSVDDLYGKKVPQPHEKNSAQAHDVDIKHDPEKFRPPPEKRRRLVGDVNKLQSTGLSASPDWARGSRLLSSQSGGLDCAQETVPRPGAPFDTSKALFVPGSGTLASAAASAVFSASAVANAAVAAAAAAGSKASLVESTDGQTQAGAILMTGGLPPRPPMPSPRAGQRTIPIPQAAPGFGLASPSNLAPGARFTPGDRTNAEVSGRPRPVPGVDVAVEAEGRENKGVNDGMSSAQESPLPRPVAKRVAAGGGFVTPKDIIRTLQNRSTPRALPVTQSRSDLDEGVSAPGTAIRENRRAFPGSSFAPVLKHSHGDIRDNDGAERRRTVTPYQATRRLSTGGLRSDRSSLDFSFRRRRGGTTSSAILTDLRPGAQIHAGSAAPNELRVNSLRVPGVEDGVLGMNRPVAVSASARKILASLDKVSRENRAGATKRVRSPLGRPPSSKRQRRSDSVSVAPDGDEEVIGGSKWFLNTIKAHAAAASSKLPRDEPPLARKSMLPRQKRVGAGGIVSKIDADGVGSGLGEGETSRATRRPVSSFRPLSRAEGGISKKRKQQRQNVESTGTRTPSAFSSLLEKDYKSSLAPAGDPDESLKTPFSFGAPSSSVKGPEADIGTGSSSAERQKTGALLPSDRQELPSRIDSGIETNSLGSKPFAPLAKSKFVDDVDQTPIASKATPPTSVSGADSGPKVSPEHSRAAFGSSVSFPSSGENQSLADDKRLAFAGVAGNAKAPAFPEVKEPAGSHFLLDSKKSASQGALPVTRVEDLASNAPDANESKANKSESPGSQPAAPLFAFGAAAASTSASLPLFSGFPSSASAPVTNVSASLSASEATPVSPSKSPGTGAFDLDSKQPESDGNPKRNISSPKDESPPPKKAVPSFGAPAPLGKDSLPSAPSSSLPFSFQIPATKPDAATSTFGAGSNASLTFQVQTSSGGQPASATESAIAPDVAKMSSGKDPEKTVGEAACVLGTTTTGGDISESQKDAAPSGNVSAPGPTTNSGTESAADEVKPDASGSEKNEATSTLPSKKGNSLFSGMKPLPSPDNEGGGGGHVLFNFGSTEDMAKDAKSAPFGAGSLATAGASTSSAPLFSFGSGGVLFGANAASKPAVQVPESGLTKSVFPTSAPAASLASSGPDIPSSNPFSAAAAGTQSGTPFSFANPSSAPAPIAANASAPALFSAPATMVPSPATGASAITSASDFSGAQFGGSSLTQQGALNSASPAPAPAPAAVTPAAPFGSFASGGLSFNPPASGAPAFQPSVPGGNPFASSSLPPPSTSAAPAVVQFGASNTAATPFGGFPKPSTSPPMVFSAPVPSAAQAPTAPSFGGNTGNPAAPFTFGAPAGAGMGVAAAPTQFGGAAPGISPFGAPGTAAPPSGTLGAPAAFNAPAPGANMFAPAPGMPGIGPGADAASGSGFNMGRSTAPPGNTRRRTLRGRRSTQR